MNPATCSCRVTTSLMEEVRSAPRKSKFSSPGTPKMYSTPSFSSARTIRSAPFTIDGCMADGSLAKLSGMTESRDRGDHTEPHVFGLLSRPGDHGDDDCRHTGNKSQPDRVVAGVAFGDACLKSCIDRGKEIAQLIDEAGKRAPHALGREFVQMHGHDTPGALHHDLKQ